MRRTTPPLGEILAFNNYMFGVGLKLTILNYMTVG